MFSLNNTLFAMKYIKYIIGALYLFITLTACASPWSGSCWYEENLPNPESVSREDLVGEYVIVKEEYKTIYPIFNNDSSISLKSNGKFIWKNSPGALRGWPSDKLPDINLEGTWSVLKGSDGTISKNRYELVMKFEEEDHLEIISLTISEDSGSFILVGISGDPDSCKGSIYKKTESGKDSWTGYPDVQEPEDLKRCNKESDCIPSCAQENCFNRILINDCVLPEERYVKCICLEGLCQKQQ